jgi:hypothetical protein
LRRQWHLEPVTHLAQAGVGDAERSTGSARMLNGPQGLPDRSITVRPRF